MLGITIVNSYAQQLKKSTTINRSFKMDTPNIDYTKVVN